MRTILVFLHLSFLIFFKCVTSDLNSNKGNCQIPQNDQFDWTLTIISLDDNKVNEELFSTPYTGSLKVDSCTNNDDNFFDVKANDTHFSIRTTQEMKNFDEKTPKKSGSVAVILVECNLICESLSTLPISFQVNDYNNHDPTFLEKSYSFDVPSPIMQKTDFTIYGQDVIAEDLDFSNQDVKFTIEPNDFEIATIKDDSSKEYRAQFAARKNLQLNEAKQYTITATDTGNNPHTRSSSTTILLKPDKKGSFDTPSFEQPQYSFSYLDGSRKLQPYDASQSSIKVLTTKPDSIEENLKITGELEQYLKPKFDPEASTISLEMSVTTIDTESAFLISTLSVKTDYTATTSIIVYIQSNSKEAPRFTKVLFTGKYQPDSRAVDLVTPIEVLSKSAVDVSISDGENKDYFSIIASENNQFIVKVNKPLPKIITQQQKTILLRLKATSIDGSGYANLAITLPTAPKFDKPSYSIEYDAKHNEIQMNGTIGVLTEDGKDSNLVLKGEYSEYFKLERGADGYKVNIDNKLPDKVLSEQKVIILEIIAEAASVETYATLVIKIEGIDSGSGGTDKNKTGSAGTTPYIVAICVMAGSLVAVIIGSVTLYCLKLRKGNKTKEDTEDPGRHTEKAKFQKHSINGPNSERKTSSIADRRPTGFICSHPEDLDVRDEVEKEGTPDSPDYTRERKKSVIFDFNVEEMPIEKLDAASIENSEVGSKTGDDSLDGASDKSDTESVGNVDTEGNADKKKESGTLAHVKL